MRSMHMLIGLRESWSEMPQGMGGDRFRLRILEVLPRPRGQGRRRRLRFAILAMLLAPPTVPLPQCEIRARQMSIHVCQRAFKVMFRRSPRKRLRISLSRSNGMGRNRRYNHDERTRFTGDGR